ncbi:caspase-4-like [Colossoma macropomum]|uniref:caspase-4-like n=1 Tax=Colossoma macropomum TaxID=42526 RepID=UPI0018644CA3|nr:caspase-4-like [Colossoma macropomum]
MSKSARDVLLEGLDDLTDEQFKRFTDKLIDSRLEPRVRRGAVEKKDRLDVTRIMIDTYTEKRALGVAGDLLKAIGCNQPAEDLEKEAAALDLEEHKQPPHKEPEERPPPGPQPNTSSPLIHCTPQFKDKILKEKGQEIYPVLDKGVRKRLALLINNVEFECENMRRRGAQRDEENMEKLLRGLGYDVVKHTNLSGQEMDEALRSFAGRSEHKESDSTFVVIMSHGKRDAILGVHHKPDNPTDFLSVDRIYSHLNTQNCPALLNKPKVILIQACRGDEKGRVWVADSASEDLWNMESDGVWEHKEKDFVSLLSCTPDTVSYRHTEHGAFFIGFLVEVFNANAHKDHIEELFRQVMRRFENFQKLKQMVSKDRISLTKLFYLFPGL